MWLWHMLLRGNKLMVKIFLRQSIIYLDICTNLCFQISPKIAEMRMHYKRCFIGVGVKCGYGNKTNTFLPLSKNHMLQFVWTVFWDSFCRDKYLLIRLSVFSTAPYSPVLIPVLVISKQPPIVSGSPC